MRAGTAEVLAARPESESESESGADLAQDASVLRRACADVLHAATGLRIPSHRQALFDWHLDRLGGGRPPAPGDLARRPGDLVALARLLAVPESYFFRHPAHFEALDAFVRERAARPDFPTRGPLRVLSAGCARGEEAWSAAAVLLPHLPADGARVEGWDLDEERIAEARRGVYRPWSLRAGLFGCDDRVEPAGQDEVRVHDELRSVVTFRCVNLAGSLPDGPAFDVLMLRNVAIYWSRDAAERIFRSLLARVSPTGLLLLGPSDPLRPGDGWVADRSYPLPVYRPAAAERTGHAPSRPRERPDPAPAAARRRRTRRTPRTRRTRRPAADPAPSALRSPAADRAPSAPPTSSPSKRSESVRAERAAPPDRVEQMEALLDQARRHADAGRYGKALETLERMEACGETPQEAQKLRGVLSFHLERLDEALAALRHAVYEAPDDADARRWLALVWERRGEPEQARRERRNADRLDGAPENSAPDRGEP